MNVHTKPKAGKARTAAKAVPVKAELPGGSEAIAPDCSGQDFYALDRGLQQLLALYLPAGIRAHMAPHFKRLGMLAGGRLDELARVADRNGPVLHARDRAGRDEDWIEYHPAYREMEAIAFGDFQFHAMSHRAGVLGLDAPMHPVAKYACQYLFVQGEFGIMCPISVTDTSIYLIRKYASPELKDYLLPRMLSADPAVQWKGTQFMTEKAGGSDIGRVETVARNEGGTWRLYGEKWFCSHTDADVALMLARPEGAPDGTRGLALFALPRRLKDGTAQQLPDRAPQGQARHALDGLGRDPFRGRRGLSRRPARPGPQADDGPGQPVATVARRAGRGHDAALRQRGADGGPPSRGVRCSRSSPTRCCAGS